MECMGVMGTCREHRRSANQGSCGIGSVFPNCEWDVWWHFVPLVKARFKWDCYVRGSCGPFKKCPTIFLSLWEQEWSNHVRLILEMHFEWSMKMTVRCQTPISAVEESLISNHAIELNKMSIRFAYSSQTNHLQFFTWSHGWWGEPKKIASDHIHLPHSLKREPVTYKSSTMQGLQKGFPPWSLHFFPGIFS